MPKLVSEIVSGQENSRSVDGGTLADTSVRTWRIILNSPSEAYNVQQAVGVYIGDAHPVNTGLPCVSISEKPDGDSRLVRVVTATYRTTPGADNNPQNDPNKQPPNVRPAKYSISSSLIEVPADQWAEVDPDWQPAPPGWWEKWGAWGLWVRDPSPVGAWEKPLNPARDRYDGVSKLVPLINISIEQFDYSPTSRLDESGSINDDEFTFLGLTVPRFTCMLRSIGVRPHVESFGDATYRGFTRTFEFSIKVGGGWVIDQVLEGFNIINTGLGDANVYQKGLNLKHDNNKVVEPFALAAGTANTKCRAVVPITCTSQNGFLQRPSAQPVALNEDGSPRDAVAKGVIHRKYITQGTRTFGANFSGMGVRIQDII